MVIRKTFVVPQTPVAFVSHLVPLIVMVLELLFEQIKHNPANGPPWGLSAMEDPNLKWVFRSIHQIVYCSNFSSHLRVI